MPIDIEKTAGVFKVVKSMTNRQLAVTLFLIVTSVTLSFWFENRYAKLVDYQNDIKEQQVAIEKQKSEIAILKSQLISITNSLPDDQRKKAIELSIANTILTTGNISNLPHLPQ